jgi:hypothetical protein
MSAEDREALIIQGLCCSREQTSLPRETGYYCRMMRRMSNLAGKTQALLKLES